MLNYSSELRKLSEWSESWSQYPLFLGIGEKQFSAVCQCQFKISHKRQSKSFQNRRLILSTFHYGSGDLAVRRRGVALD